MMLFSNSYSHLLWLSSSSKNVGSQNVLWFLTLKLHENIHSRQCSVGKSTATSKRSTKVPLNHPYRALALIFLQEQDQNFRIGSFAPKNSQTHNHQKYFWAFYTKNSFFLKFYLKKKKIVTPSRPHNTELIPMISKWISKFPGILKNF